MGDDRATNDIVNDIPCKNKLLAGHLSIGPPREQFPGIKIPGPNQIRRSDWCFPRRVKLADILRFPAVVIHASKGIFKG